ncbi:hypothetical protein AVEN_172099-1 [Araneus ventricosus]|uniref:CCHC-type domain-containing protein n=1 Tax=Araneus ventricosus TaxID=182803 RepID=A0A4Y2EBT9_ARAVE|nr:hypothetical protein AVEN_137197-1 [Araneus ventricosus]GBM25314.1 hypothetical protein AVEN_172099-1 [Araneus ventricosus]
MDKQEIQQCLEEKGFKIERITQMKNFREKSLLPLFLTDVKKIGNYANIYNIKELRYYRIKVEPYRKRKKATICFNCSGFFHSARNCHMRPRCIECNGEHATRDCSITEKIIEPTCINCGEKGHLAAWKGCKALPIIKKPAVRQKKKTCAQAATAQKKTTPIPEGKSKGVEAEQTTDLSDLKESLQTLREIKTLIQEFPTLLEAVSLCRKAKNKQEKILIVLNALVSD